METTRDRILEAALSLFSEHGYRGATTAEIARQASVAEGTIYRYFRDKKDLFLACVEPVIQEALRRESALPNEGTARERLRRRIKERVRVIRENLPVLNILFSEGRHHPEIANILLEQIAASVSPDQKAAFEGSAEAVGFRPHPHALLQTVGLTAAVWSLVSIGPHMHPAFASWLAPDWYDRLDDDIADFFADAILAPEQP